MKHIWCIIKEEGAYFAIETPPENLRPGWRYVEKISGFEKWYSLDTETRRLTGTLETPQAKLFEVPDIQLPDDQEIVVVTQEIVQHISYYTESV